MDHKWKGEIQRWGTEVFMSQLYKSPTNISYISRFEVRAPSQDALSSGFARHVLKRCCRLGKYCDAAVLSSDWQVLECTRARNDMYAYGSAAKRRISFLFERNLGP